MFLQVLGNSLRESKQIELKACQICWEKIKIEINLPTTSDDEHRWWHVGCHGEPQREGEKERDRKGRYNNLLFSAASTVSAPASA